MAFNLSSVSKSRRKSAIKAVISGVSKVGKSSMAADAPKPVFLPLEDGLAGLDVDAFPLASSMDDVYAAIGTLINEKHDFKTLVIDSADWLEPLLHAYVCRQHKWESIETPGYGKGYMAAATEWKTLLDGLETLRRDCDMNIIVICHVKQTHIESPTAEGYDAWTLKLHTKASALLEEWADIIGFAAHKIAVKKTDAGFGQKETKAIKTGERVLHLEAHPAYPSGNRFGLRDCALSWDALASQLQA